MTFLSSFSYQKERKKKKKTQERKIFLFIYDLFIFTTAINRRNDLLKLLRRKESGEKEAGGKKWNVMLLFPVKGNREQQSNNPVMKEKFPTHK